MIRAAFLGVTMDAVTLNELQGAIVVAIARKQRCVVANHNLHSVYLFHHDPRMRQLYRRSELTYVDGMPLIFLGRALGLPLRSEQRVTFLDSFDVLLASAARQGWRVFYLGSRPEVAEEGARILRQRHPGLQFRSRHGFFDMERRGEQNRAVLADIQQYEPHLLLVGMGMPRQEHWVAENLEQLPPCVILTSGATLDFVAGAAPTPPAWAGPLGLYWLFRFFHEPRRLARRYLLEPWFVMRLFASDLALRLGLTQKRVETNV